MLVYMTIKFIVIRYNLYWHQKWL